MIDPLQSRRRRRPRGSPLDHAPEVVRFARQNAGLTQEQLGAALGLSRQRMCDIEHGRRNAPVELLERMAERLDFPLVALLAKPPTDARPDRSHKAQQSPHAGGAPPQ